MPPLVAAGALTSLGTGLTIAAPVAAGLIGAKVSSNANKSAAQTAAASSDKALQIAQDNEMERRKEYNDAQAAAKAQWDAEQARLAPRRALQDQLLSQYANRTGLSLGQMAQSQPVSATPPPGWTPGTVSSAPRSIAQMAGYEQSPDVTPSQSMAIGNIFDWGTPRRVN